MEDHLDKAFVYFGLEDIDFQRITVTEEQIEQLGLPAMPKSVETINKVNNDTGRCINQKIRQIVCRRT